jgi:hypothetical protein
VISVLNAWLAAESWPEQEAVIHEHQSHLTDAFFAHTSLTLDPEPP